MASCRTKRVEPLAKKQPNRRGSTLVKALAPEEICRGDYVTPLEEIAELPSFFWCADATVLPYDQPVRIRFVPSGRGGPLKVKRVCLPFVLLKHPKGERQTVDLRKYRLAQLGKAYARAAWKACKRARAKLDCRL